MGIKAFPEWTHIVMSQHAVKMIEKRNLQSEVMDVLDHLKEDPLFFIENSKRIVIESKSGKEKQNHFMLKSGSLYLIFALEPKEKSLVLVTIADIG